MTPSCVTSGGGPNERRAGKANRRRARGQKRHGREPWRVGVSNRSPITEAEARAEAARVAFLDPVQSPDANRARALVETTRFAADRLRTLMPRLGARFQEADAREAAVKWRADYDKLKVERDALAQDLGKVYPSAVAAIVDVLDRIAAFEGRASALHGSKPAGVKGLLLSPELIARNLDGFSRDQPSIVRELKLVDWSNSSKLAWPPLGPSARTSARDR